jgi:hypothetical protein
LPSQEQDERDEANPLGDGVLDADMLQFATDAPYEPTPSPSPPPESDHGDLRLSSPLPATPSPSSSPPPSPIPTKGRIPQATKDTVNSAFRRVDEIFRETAERTGRSSSQLVSLWNQTHARTNGKNNEWNMYQAYFTDHRDEERARDEDPEATGEFASSRCRLALNPF